MKSQVRAKGRKMTRANPESLKEFRKWLQQCDFAQKNNKGAAGGKRVGRQQIAKKCKDLKLQYRSDQIKNEIARAKCVPVPSSDSDTESDLGMSRLSLDGRVSKDESKMMMKGVLDSSSSESDSSMATVVCRSRPQSPSRNANLMLASKSSQNPAVQQPIACILRSPDAKDPLPIVAGKYTLGEQIGSGTFAKVFRVMSREGCLRAAKMGAPKALQSEKDLLLKLNHPHIIKLHDWFVTETDMILVLEFFPATIKSWLPLCQQQVSRFMGMLLNGLMYLHELQHQILHLDIKAANLLVDAGGRLAIADFGTAMHSQDLAELTDPVGTLRFMAPEVLQCKIHQDSASAADIWSTGCTVIEMTSGFAPYFHANDLVVRSQLTHYGIRLDNVEETLGSTGAEFLRLCLQYNPVQRPSARKALEHDFVRAI